MWCLTTCVSTAPLAPSESAAAVVEQSYFSGLSESKESDAISCRYTGCLTTPMLRSSINSAIASPSSVACHEGRTQEHAAQPFLRLNGVSLIGLQPSYLIFSTPGCWEVTALVGGHEDSN